MERKPKPLQSEHLGAQLHLGWFNLLNQSCLVERVTPQSAPALRRQVDPRLILKVEADKLSLLLEGGGGLAASDAIQGSSTAQEEAQKDRSAPQDARQRKDA